MKTDGQLQQDVTAELEWESSIDAARIGVEVRNGRVTLSGNVESYSEKSNAEAAAKRVGGVTALASEIEIVLPGPGRRDDVDIAHAAEHVLRSTSALPGHAIEVRVDGGWITLSGEVDREYQRRAAASRVRHLAGVTGVSDRITIKPMASLDRVKADIEAALQRRASSATHDVSVEVHGADVTLRGTVGTWSEREMARNSAWGTVGVRDVVDKMTVARE